ncbi:CGP-CTERM sorting domain-containing protein [Thermococcus aciditolerans]|uniref:CGP-CTERM sorting domain-containing protein n=1 Tax=Thermococcus aciditolerans TaxID=2598455 RepID=A0A5C0SJQ9_9EURY|nr:CGP-CTERM sorting domain-containing protein [Thermococcus aciditolerans]QEK14500.1 CGP-CTERM sorting domain-containing protein [Thermococcus aciditolerans]
MKRIAVFLTLFIITLPVNSLVFAFQGVSKLPTTVYEIHISGIGTKTRMILTVDVSIQDYGTYTLAYTFTHCVRCSNFTYIAFMGLPGERFTLGNITLSWPTNRFKVYSVENDVILRWWQGNKSFVDYAILGDNLVRVYTEYSPPPQIIGKPQGDYIVFGISNLTVRVSLDKLERYYPKVFLSELGATVYYHLVNWDEHGNPIYRQELLIYPVNITYWKNDGKLYVGPDSSAGVPLVSALPLLLYANDTLKPVADILRMTTPVGDPLRNLPNPYAVNATVMTPEKNALENCHFSPTDHISIYLYSNGSTAMLRLKDTSLELWGSGMTCADWRSASWVPMNFLYLFKGETPVYLNLSAMPHVDRVSNPPLPSYHVNVGVANGTYYILWQYIPEGSSKMTSQVYGLENDCLCNISNSFPGGIRGFVAHGKVIGDSIVFHFLNETLQIPLQELGKYYPDPGRYWSFTAARDGKGYLIAPGSILYGLLGSSFAVYLNDSYFWLLGNSRGVYALYYSNGTLKPAFTILPGLSPVKNQIRLKPCAICPSVNRTSTNSSTPVNSTGTSPVKSSTGTSSQRATSKAGGKSICGPGLIVLLTVGVLLKRIRR